MRKYAFLFIITSLIIITSCEKENSLQIDNQFSLYPIESLEILTILDLGETRININNRSEESDGIQVRAKMKNPETGDHTLMDLLLFPSDDYRTKFIRRLNKDQWDKIKDEYTGLIIAYEKNNFERLFSAIYSNGEYRGNLLGEEELTTYFISDDDYNDIISITVITDHYTDWIVNGEYVNTTYEGRTTETFTYVSQDAFYNGIPVNDGDIFHGTSTTSKAKEDKWEEDPSTDQDDKNRSYIKDGILRFPICGEETFPFSKTGDAGYTVNVNDFMHGYWWDVIHFRTYKIPSMCIQVPNHDYGKPIDWEEAANRTAIAFDDARLEIFEMLQIGLLNTSAEAKRHWRIHFLSQLREQWNLSFRSQNITVSYGNCESSGVNSSNIYHQTPFGCIKSEVK